MDALTLLCNRFGDGPTMLAQLRAAGCRECIDIERLALDQLTKILGAAPELAEQLQREAHLVVESFRETARATPLRPGLLPNLELQHCIHLRRLGVDSLEDLDTAGALELARELEVGVERIVRWQTLARAAIQTGSTPKPTRDVSVTPPALPVREAARPSPRFSPTETGFVPRPSGLERDLASFDAAAGRKSVSHA